MAHAGLGNAQNVASALKADWRGVTSENVCQSKAEWTNMNHHVIKRCRTEMLSSETSEGSNSVPPLCDWDCELPHIW
jgi:hypothetical protein